MWTNGIDRVTKGMRPGRLSAVLGLLLLAAAFATIASAQSSSPPLTRTEFETLTARGQLVVRRIDVAVPTDVERIEQTGVVIWTSEPLYVIVAGDQARMDAVRALGFSPAEPSESDYKLRFFRTRILSRDDYERLRSLMSDVLPIVDFPSRVVGRAYDYQLKWAREAAFLVEICKSFADCNRQ